LNALLFGPAKAAARSILFFQPACQGRYPGPPLRPPLQP